MAKIEYQDVPSLAQWKKDSYVLLGIRSSDRVLGRIDELLSLFHDEHDEVWELYRQKYVLSDLFFTTDYWLKCAGRNESVNRSREPAVSALYRAIVGKLCELFKVTVNVLPRELEKAFGREMNYYGQRLDVELGQALYLTRAEADFYRVRFEAGLAYQWDDEAELALASSRKHTSIDLEPYNQGYAGFVMSMGRDIYMAKHFFGGEGQSFLHSSYLAGQPVLCAGTVKIVSGRVKGLTNYSGHYRPTADHLVNVLEALRMYGVNLKDVEVIALHMLNGKKAELKGTAAEFLTCRGNWDRMERLSKEHYKVRDERKRERTDRSEMGNVNWTARQLFGLSGFPNKK
jgi:hypothetical protein